MYGSQERRKQTTIKFAFCFIFLQEQNSSSVQDVWLHPNSWCTQHSVASDELHNKQLALPFSRMMPPIQDNQRWLFILLKLNCLPLRLVEIPLVGQYISYRSTLYYICFLCFLLCFKRCNVQDAAQLWRPTKWQQNKNRFVCGCCDKIKFVLASPPI